MRLGPEKHELLERLVAEKRRALQEQAPLIKPWETTNDDEKHALEPHTKPKTKPTPTMSNKDKRKTLHQNRERAKQLREKLMHDEMKECTFTPNISKTSIHAHKDRPSFVERSNLWEQQRIAQRDARRKLRNSQETQECTFRPVLSQRPSTPQKRKTQAAAPATPHRSVVDRLFDPLAHQATQETRRRQREQREAEEERQCTFHPRVNAPNRSNAAMTDIASRYRESPRPRRRASIGAPPFTPRTNPLPNGLSEASASYLNQAAHERLARTSSKSLNGEVRKPKSHISPREGENVPWGVTLRRSSSTPKFEPPHDGSSNETFNRFIERQRTYSEKRRAMEEAAHAEVAAQMRGPALSQGTARIVARSGLDRPTFLERMQESTQKFVAASLSSLHSSSAPWDEECTFAPQIDNRARSLRGRSVEELSLGDVARRERMRERRRRELENEEAVNLTFRPTINADYSGVESRLKVTSDPATYMARVKQHMQLKQKVVECVREAQDAKALEECTFQPRTHEVPAYISRIAKSMAVAKMARPSTAPERPEWK